MQFCIDNYATKNIVKLWNCSPFQQRHHYHLFAIAAQFYNERAIICAIFVNVSLFQVNTRKGRKCSQPSLLRPPAFQRVTIALVHLHDMCILIFTLVKVKGPKIVFFQRFYSYIHNPPLFILRFLCCKKFGAGS